MNIICHIEMSKFVKSCCAFKKSLGNFVFEYETPKIVTIRSVRVGLINRFLQLAIISYIVGYAIIYNKGYQVKDVGLSTVMTKVKGISSSLDRDDLPETYKRVWDTADFIIPPMLKDSVFITTNAIITPQQKIDVCPEDPGAGKDAVCDPEAAENVTQCEKDGRLKYGVGNGILTGKCIESDRTEKFTCQVKTWCPVENDKLDRSFFRPLLNEIGTFTIFLKNTVEFPKFSAKKRNVDDIKDPNYVKRCLYHPKKDPKCPIMKLADILTFAKANITELSIFGGVINVLIQWSCDLDYSIEHCRPIITFSQMDEPKSAFSPGHNFRYAYYYRENGTLYRDLIKAYGVLFLFNVKAQAGQFNIVQLMFNIGAGLALLGITSVLMDMIVFHIGKDKQYYRQQKFVTVTESQCRRHKAFAPLNSALLGTAMREDAAVPKSISSLNSALSASANLIKKPMSSADFTQIAEEENTKKSVSFVDGTDIRPVDDEEDE